MSNQSFHVRGNLVDIEARKIYPAQINVSEGLIKSIQAIDNLEPDHQQYILPGFIDSHVHIESSMLVPSEFARLAVVHGTIATVSDPHEIANVCGMQGIDFMIENGNTVPFKFFFGAPSCVPATNFETAGAEVNSDDVKKLLAKPEIKYLSEMMNFPGVLHQDPEVMKKIAYAREAKKPVDGHAPGLRGKEVETYIAAGISTDHECFTKEEALEKLEHGMKIIIREGSAAKNFDALIELLHDYPNEIMFCSDDKHPDSLVTGHINQLCERAIAKGIDLFNVLQAACINPVKHYQLPVGLLKVGDQADFIITDNLQKFSVVKTFINGELVAENGKSNIQTTPSATINHFNCKPIKTQDIIIPKDSFPVRNEKIPVIEALDGQLITNQLWLTGTEENDTWVSNTEKDILKMIVVNRYHAAPVAVCFIKNFGFKSGAIASSVAHDSHNIVAVGADDLSIVRAVNAVIEQQGGISCVSGNGETSVLALPVAGLMSNKNGYEVAEAYTLIDTMAKNPGIKAVGTFYDTEFYGIVGNSALETQ